MGVAVEYTKDDEAGTPVRRKKKEVEEEEEKKSGKKGFQPPSEKVHREKKNAVRELEGCFSFLSYVSFDTAQETEKNGPHCGWVFEPVLCRRGATHKACAAPLDDGRLHYPKESDQARR